MQNIKQGRPQREQNKWKQFTAPSTGAQQIEYITICNVPQTGTLTHQRTQETADKKGKWMRGSQLCRPTYPNRCGSRAKHNNRIR